MHLDVFAKRLKALRLSRSLTLQNVGDGVGCLRHAIGNFEHSRASPSLAMVTALADFFSVSIDYLVGRTDDPAGPGGGGEMTVPEPEQNIEKEKLIGMVKTLHDDDTDRAMIYLTFLRYARRREDWKKRRAYRSAAEM